MLSRRHPGSLEAGAISADCSLRVGAGAGESHSLAIRQRYRGREVGGVTWRFRAPE